MKENIRKHKKWCESEEITFATVYPYISNRILAERFGTSYRGIERKASKMKLKKDEKVRKEIRIEALKKTKNRKRKLYTISKNGIKMIYAPDHPKALKYEGFRIGEHILVMEKFLGRYLEDNERVLHKDGNPQNNDLSNLYIQKRTIIERLNAKEIAEKRKSGVSIRKLIEEYNISMETLYKILRMNDCINKQYENEYQNKIKDVINGMLDLWLDPDIEYFFNEDVFLYYKNVITKEGKITKEEFEKIITKVLKKRKIDISELT